MLKRAVHRALRAQGKELASIDELSFYRSMDTCSKLYSQLPQASRELIAPFLPYTKSQLAQDLFALAFSENSAPKFFVEFGATDGVSLSNTWLLEKKLGWKGILAEPAKTWHAELKRNRSCILDTRCVAKESGLKYQFLEVIDSGGGYPELSGIEEFALNGDWASDIRSNNSIRYEVETISLNDLLDENDAPGEIQFLSLDTEGSEFEILSGYNFAKRKINSICVEHNFVAKTRSLIHALMVDKGYKQVLERISNFDDWYVLDRK